MRAGFCQQWGSMSCSCIQIKNIQRSVHNETFRISADVNGVTVWYEAECLELAAATEVFACAFLVPAMMQGAPLRLEGGLSNGWKKNSAQLMKLFHEWWGYPVIEILTDDAPPTSPVASGRTGLFFTGGVDSFYSLLRSGMEIDDLVYVCGFDVSVEDEQRLADIRVHLEAVASEVGKRLIILKTNLREHPLIREAGWGRVHGGALAPAAFCLADLSTLIISSSYSRMTGIPWGSHWQSDPLWSNERLEVVHFGEQVVRSDKLREIADEPVVQKHLRVCWKNRNEHLNCCRCEKCVRTMLALHTCGKLEPYEVFPGRSRLSDMIRGVRYIPDGIIPVYEEFLERGLPRGVAQAVQALLRRSRFRLFRKSIVAALLPGKADE